MTLMSDLQALRDAVGAIEARLREKNGTVEPLLEKIHPDYRVSARNFIHYITLRQIDLRSLQLDLVRHGLSSLGRLEGHVLDAVTKVRERLDDALARGNAAAPAASPTTSEPTWEQSNKLLHEHTRALLGPRPADRHVYIMVTAPDAVEVDDAWVERMLANGMNVLRVNTAHEDETAWTHIVTTARRVAAARNTNLRIAVDLPGPKVRTAILTEGPRVEKWKPVRDDFGRVVSPCTITLGRESKARVEPKLMRVPDAVWPDLGVGDELVFRDARGKQRIVVVTQREDYGGTGKLFETAYVVPETTVTLRRGGSLLAEWRVGSIAPRRLRVPLAVDESFCLVKTGAEPLPGMKAIGCTLEAALDSLQVGQRVLFDDGHLEAIVDRVEAGRAVLRVTYAAGGSFKLADEKGINFPDTELKLPLVSNEDEQALRFAAHHADIVDASFVRGPDDVRELHQRLAALDAARIGLVLKIETSRAFDQLPAIILAALERAPVGVMIARGDLAIESGYERLAELQEEMLWLCEAAHIPVIWATQVLDLLARTGRPSRAEVTDAAMAARAECVMLNKGAYVGEAADALVDILRRMEQHQYKKRSLYRRLHLRLPHVRRDALR